MNAELRVGTLSAKQGEKTTGVQPVKIGEREIELPIFLINGNSDGPTLAVTGGIHGAEYASIEAALRLGRMLTPQQLHGRVIVVPIVSVPMYKTRSIYISPLDGLNINRVFPGKADGQPSEQLANWVFENVIKQGNYYVDLHGGDMNEALVPFTLYQKFGNPTVDKTSLEMAQVFGIRYLVSSEVKGSTVSAAASVGIPGILPESGGQGIWREEHIAAHSNGLNRLMRHLKMIDGPAPEPMPTQIMDQLAWLRSDHDGCWYPKVAVGANVKKGQDIGQVTDFAGKVLQPVTAPIDGTILFLVSSLAINKGDPLLSVGG